MLIYINISSLNTIVLLKKVISTLNILFKQIITIIFTIFARTNTNQFYYEKT